jgi:hypothetical protein
VAVPDDNMRALIRRLTVGTEKGTVKWAVQSPQAYVLEGAAAKVTVQSGADDDSHPYYFEVRNPGGLSSEAGTRSREQATRPGRQRSKVFTGQLGTMPSGSIRP